MSEGKWTPLLGTVSELVAEAVAAERVKCKKAVADAIREIHAERDPAMPVYLALEACRDAIEKPGTEPAPEPTISAPGIMAKLQEAAYPEVAWPEIKKDIDLLIADERERILAATAIAFDDGKLRSRAGLFTTFRNIVCASNPPESEPIASPVAEAVAAERRRDVGVVYRAMRTARQRNDDRLANDLRDCLRAIEAPDETPPPPPAPEPMGDSPKTALGKKLCVLRTNIIAAGTPEPMTVETVIEKLGSGRYDGDRHWDDLRTDLFVLVEEQARRDANLTCGFCREHILKAAELE